MLVKECLNNSIKKLIACGLLIGSTVISIGGNYPKVELVADTYTVQAGDSLWSIFEDFLQKNTGGRRYILEFKSGIKELNPWLLERPSECEIYPSDELHINYWVKVDEE
jgi:hypothetical protein